ncbi:MAG TPA: hypothetical protein VEZ11_08500 [Thermoanaerobaculia bacterium]|nr:hypothetical protein [Thermoanaerobaculia bacterium]
MANLVFKLLEALPRLCPRVINSLSGLIEAPRCLIEALRRLIEALRCLRAELLE